MKIKTLMLFAYDFPHKKTQDFIIRLLTEGYNIKYIVAAPWKALPIGPSSIRITPRQFGLIHPRLLCKRFKINYIVGAHNSRYTITYLKKNPVDLCIIAGARIISEKTVEATNNKILNVHPGLLPQVRGLDTLMWSINYNIPIGISAHLIGSKIDGGKLIYRKRLPLFKDDSILDISLRLLEMQQDILILALKKLSTVDESRLLDMDTIKSKYNSKMPVLLEKKTLSKFKSWLKDLL